MARHRQSNSPSPTPPPRPSSAMSNLGDYADEKLDLRIKDTARNLGMKPEDVPALHKRHLASLQGETVTLNRAYQEAKARGDTMGAGQCKDQRDLNRYVMVVKTRRSTAVFNGKKAILDAGRRKEQNEAAGAEMKRVKTASSAMSRSASESSNTANTMARPSSARSNAASMMARSTSMTSNPANAMARPGSARSNAASMMTRSTSMTSNPARAMVRSASMTSGPVASAPLMRKLSGSGSKQGRQPGYPGYPQGLTEFPSLQRRSTLPQPQNALPMSSYGHENGGAGLSLPPGMRQFGSAAPAGAADFSAFAPQLSRNYTPRNTSFNTGLPSNGSFSPTGTMDFSAGDPFATGEISFLNDSMSHRHNNDSLFNGNNGFGGNNGGGATGGYESYQQF